ncbi:MAG: N-acetylglucosamine-6-phosphate deacetylase [Acidobacteriota bacterium]|nr:N-acetylglucosamine-6-phosphate deacetylase [Acidobacteriota bacterium]
MRTLLTAARYLGPAGIVSQPWFLLEGATLVAAGSRGSAQAPAADRRLAFPDSTLAPAFFDVHLHGAAGHDVMEATPEALGAISRFLAGHGVGSFLATTVTASIDDTLRALSRLAQLQRQQQPGAQPLGIHLEGPFLSHAKRGVHRPELLQPAERTLFDRFWQAAEGTIRLLTLAPELPGAVELAAHATALGVRVSLGHSNADAETTQRAIRAGASSATHTFNAMRALDHREPGILGTVLSDQALFAELICDGVHVHPDLVRLWWRAKGPQRSILITDAMRATGMPDGTYTLAGQTVQVAHGRATADGVLAGSVLTLDRALTNFLRFTGATLDQAIPLLTTNPATMTGLHTAAPQPGSPADFTVLAPDGTLQATLLRGALVEPS